MAMAAKKKQAKFFCEYCDSEVPINARFCPKCGHFFLAVRCPACGKTGDQDEFTNGCPQCGYAFNGEPIKASGAAKTTASSKLNTTFRTYTGTSSSKKRSDDALPPWIYIATLTGFAIVLLILFIFSNK